MSSENKRVLIFGGTGHYGRKVTYSLIHEGASIKLLTRNTKNAENLFGNKVEIVAGDLENSDSLDQAFQNVDRIIYAVSAMSVNQIRRFKEIEQDAVVSSLRLAQKRGIKRVVYISVFEANREFAQKHRITTANEKAFVEAFIAESGFNWTILGAPPSMDIFFRMIHGKNMMVPGGGPKGLPTVSAIDVGEIAAQATVRDDLSGRRIQMVAPQAYSFSDAADRISKVWETKIRYRKIPLILPKIAYCLTAPPALFSNRLLYVHRLLGFVRLLNNFPEQYIQKVPLLHEKLLSDFSYSPSTLEIEAERRKPKEMHRNSL